MSSFQNQSEVHNQIGHQTVHGTINHHHHHVNESVAGKRRRLGTSGTESHSDLDYSILTSLAFPEMTDRRRNIAPPSERTCEWVLQVTEYQKWADMSSGLLWIKGKPGAGKSTLMSHLYTSRLIGRQAAPSNAVHLEFFFTARGAPLERSPLGMFRALSNQLFHLDVSVREVLRKHFLEQKASFGDVVWKWQQYELQKLFTDMVLASAQQRQLIILVDALDEAGMQAAEETAHYFHRLNKEILKQALNAKIIISCRHYPVPPSIRNALEIHVEQYNYDAIESYIQDYVDGFIDVGENTNATNWQVLVQDLSKMANGVFQWACLVMPLVRRRVLGGNLLNEIQQWLPHLPTELEQVYEHILRLVIFPEHRIQSLRLFQWVCLANRPLTISEVRYALATHDLVLRSSPPQTCPETSNFVRTDEVMKCRIQPWSGGLIELVQNESTLVLQPTHLSVNSFLMARGFDLLLKLIADGSNQSGDLKLAIGRDVGITVAYLHRQIYWSLLTYIASEQTLLSILDTILQFEDWKYNSRFGINAVRDQMIKSPLLRYAAAEIIYHAKRAQEQRDKDYAHEVLLLKQVIPTWANLSKLYEDRINEQPKHGTTPLHVAALAGSADLTAYILKHTADVFTVDESGQTALHLAVKSGHYLICKTLFDAGADINKMTADGETPLKLAARHGYVEIFSWLLRHGASIQDSQTGSTNALYEAASCGKIAVAKLCIVAGADINAQGGEYHTALQAACYDGSTEIVTLLLDAGADVNAQGGEYHTALQAACYDGSTEIVTLLLDAGADVNTQGGWYGNALQAACYDGSTEIVTLLLDAGVDVNAQGGEYHTALQAACIRRSIEIVTLLLDAGADVNAQGGRYGNALQAACYDGSMEIVTLLLDAGADINAQAGNFHTALQAACYDGSIEKVTLLLDAGADVNAQGGEYHTALQAVCFDGSMKIVTLLLDAGANVNAEGGRYGNALQAACYDGSIEKVTLILDAGADVNVRSGKYGTALDVATSLDHQPIVQLLKEAGAKE